jgi:hypothetical protein
MKDKIKHPHIEDLKGSRFYPDPAYIDGHNHEYACTCSTCDNPAPYMTFTADLYDTDGDLEEDGFPVFICETCITKYNLENIVDRTTDIS